MNVGKITVGIIVALAAIAFFSIFIVKEVNQAIVLQFGDPKRIILKPGLNFKLPFIQNVVFLDKRILNLDTPPEEVIASDQKRLIVDAFARFQIVDPLKFYISVGDERVARSRLSTIINSRIRGVLGTQELATLLSTDRARQMQIIQSQVNQEAQNFGIQITQVQTQKADPPDQVIDAFRDVQAARADMERSKNEAEAYANDVIPRARGEAQKILQAAEAYKKEVVAKAEGEASRFLAIYNEYKNAKEVTQERMYLETMEKVLADIDKVIIEKNAGSGVVPYIPLPELKKKATN